MTLPRVLLASALLVPFSAGAVRAQVGPTPEQQACIKEFMVLKEAAEKSANAIRAAGQRKATPKEACVLFNRFSASEVKLIRYMETNNARCGIPPQLVQQVKGGHARTAQLRKQVCEIAANQARPQAPSLSQALGSNPLPSLGGQTGQQQTGTGTFNTLTGNALAR